LKKNYRFQFLALTFIILTFIAPFEALAEEYATRGEFAALVMSAADDYGAPDSADLLKGYEDGSLKEDQLITRFEAYAIVSRAFGALPAPAGGALYGAPPAPALDAPDWAAEDAANLAGARVIVSGGGEFITVKESKELLSRIFALYASNLKDDFFHSANKDWLDEADKTLREGEISGGTFNEISQRNDDRIETIIKEIAAAPATEKERKIAVVYNNYLNMEARNAAGFSPITPYLDAINEARDLKALYAAHNKIYQELVVSPLFVFDIGVGMTNPNEYELIFEIYTPPLPKERYETGASLEAYQKYLIKLLTLAGDSEPEKTANAVIGFDKIIAAAQLPPEDQLDIEKIYNPYSLEALSELLGTDIGEILDDSGFAREDTVIVTDAKKLEAFAGLYNEENLETLKAVVKTSLIVSAASAFGQDCLDAAFEYNSAMYGATEPVPLTTRARAATSSLLRDYVGEIFVAKFFSEQARADVLDIINDSVGIFRNRLQNLTWMTDATKQKAIAKIDALTIKVGYPEIFESDADSANILSIAEGGSFFQNAAEIAKSSRAASIKKQNMPTDKTDFYAPLYEVNAFYNPQVNEIVFPAGILQDPFYDVTASREKNLGGIGWIISHEITHAFDSSGSLFDETGAVANWWSEEDYAAFETLCDKVVALYDGREILPGTYLNGKLTLGENIADIGGFACVLDAMKQLENPNYDELFKAGANTWKDIATPQVREYYALIDPHSPNFARVNVVFANFSEFYEEYGIDETDAMYISPENRILIW
jgi:putative endopeptidase